MNLRKLIEVCSFLHIKQETMLISTSHKRLFAYSWQMLLFLKWKCARFWQFIIIHHSKTTCVCMRCVFIEMIVSYSKKHSGIYVWCQVEKAGLVVIMLSQSTIVYLKTKYVMPQINTLFKQLHKWMCCQDCSKFIILNEFL